jgi:methionyl-tRNA synthetase
MVNKNFGEQPDVTGRTPDDDAVLATVDELLATANGQLERVELKAALRTAMDAAQAVNAYLNATEPWKIAKEDLGRAGVVLGTALDAINGVRIGFAPFLPFSTAALDEVLGPVDGWARTAVPAGTPIPKPTPLFTKVDVDALLADLGD